MNNQITKDYEKATGHKFQRSEIEPAEAVPASVILIACAIVGLVLLIIPVIAGLR